MPKYLRFREWCKTNGVFNPSVEYPVAFGKHGHLVGMCAARDVPPMTAFLYIPWNLLINAPNIRERSPEMGSLFDHHPELFFEHENAEYIQLAVYVWHERTKGENSFYKPFLDIINDSDLPFTWSDEELAEFQDAVLISNIKSFRAFFELEWNKIYEVLSSNKCDHIIPGISDGTRE